MIPVDSNFGAVLGLLVNYFPPEFAFSFTVLKKNSLFVCTGFRIKLVCIFVLSSSSQIWFQHKQLFD